MKTISIHKPPIKLKINLENMPHSVFRRLLVPEDINMLQLHFVIQYAMGWTNSHMFQFQDKQARPSFEASLPDEFDEEDFFAFGPQPERKDADKAMLKQDFLEALDGKPFWYWYDFGDDWWHKISFQKVTKKDLQIYQGRPVCLEAAGACPPEDVGGPWGYNQWLDVIMDKKHPGHSEMREWVGMSPSEKFDPDFADLDAINTDIASLPDMEEWHLTAQNYFDE